MTEILNTVLDKQSLHDKTPNYALRRTLAAGALGLSLAGTFGLYKGAEAVVNHVASPIEYSDTKTTYTTESNDGLLAIATGVNRTDNVDLRDVASHIRSMPENADAFADGIQVRETFIIPAEAKKN
jgi:hypothetical protein